MPAPTAERRPEKTVHHGRERIDDYAWLKDKNWQQVMHDPSVLDPAIRAYLEAENAWTEAALEHTEPLQEHLFTEMRGRIKEDDSSVPAPDGPYAYAMRYELGAQHPLIVREPRDAARKGDHGAEEVLLDADFMASGKAYFRMASADHSPNHKLIHYAVDEMGSEFYTIRIRDIASGEDFADAIPRTTGSAVWSAGSDYLFYTWLDDNHRPKRVMRHRVGTSPDDDVVIYEEDDPGFFVGVSDTQSGRFIVISTHDHETSELRLIDASQPESEPVMVAPRRKGIEYRVDHHAGRGRDDELVILTNADAAEDFKIATCPLASPGPENWRDFVPHREGRLILDMVSYRDHLVRLEREDGLPRIVVHRYADGEEHAIAFQEEAYSLGLLPGYEYDTATIRFSYSSMRTPSEVFDYDMESRQRTLRKRQEVPSGHDPDRYVVRRLHATSWDGETVPVTLLYRTDTPLDGSAPCLLYGYGSYGISIPAAFNTNWLSLADRGFVYAIAHIRGGKDKGYHWYRDGKGAKKTNTFKDFVAVGEYLADAGITARGRIVAHGGSAGGMLMGAVANMAPDLFLGIVAEVPFVDVLATMLDDTLPLTPPEWPEWGNPIESAKEYDQIAAYSPYDNVREQAYPNILALCGLTDPRVTYWEPAKWIAKLRTHNTSDATILLRTNMEAGHAGAAGRFDRLKEIALVYAFALKMAGALKIAGKAE
ncbi:S9 family peptidase [Microbaculum marinisediminis]|uniref:S9 family peptidase n=1 Tax=Microbaculum marinisediminis TaxID=2931392 RepID=A0AAW5QW82_9HYPH|nr:S9 family peptidase [Microbaculum sp. A6E488]MCT8971262.1 S9 family peptidase [Microbaculum sp. A6E488]